MKHKLTTTILLLTLLWPNHSTYAVENGENFSLRPRAAMDRKISAGAGPNPNTPYAYAADLPVATLETASKVIERRLRAHYRNQGGIDYEHCASVGVEEAVMSFDSTKGTLLSSWLYRKGFQAAIDKVRLNTGRMENGKKLRPLPQQFPNVTDDYGRETRYDNLISDHRIEREETARDAGIFFDEKFKGLLSPAAELMLRLRYFEGKTIKEIAEILGKTQSDVLHLMEDIMEDLRARRYSNANFRLNSSIVSSGIGSRIREVREGLGMSKKEFSELVGVHADSVGIWERETHFPTYNTIANLAAVTGAPLQYLLKGEKGLWTKRPAAEGRRTHSDQKILSAEGRRTHSDQKILSAIEDLKERGLAMDQRRIAKEAGLMESTVSRRKVENPMIRKAIEDAKGWVPPGIVRRSPEGAPLGEARPALALSTNVELESSILRPIAAGEQP